MITAKEKEYYSQAGYEQLYSDMLDLAQDGKLESLSYILKHKILPISHNNTLTTLNEVFSYACDGGHVSVLQYLLDSSDVLDYPAIDLENNNFLQIAIIHNSQEVIQYLIFDRKITYSSKIKQYIANKPEIQQFFQLRELNYNLNKILPNPEHSSKLKI